MTSAAPPMTPGDGDDRVGRTDSGSQLLAEENNSDSTVTLNTMPSLGTTNFDSTTGSTETGRRNVTLLDVDAPLSAEKPAPLSAPQSARDGDGRKRSGRRGGHGGRGREFPSAMASLGNLTRFTGIMIVIYVGLAISCLFARESLYPYFIITSVGWALVQPGPSLYPRAIGGRMVYGFLFILGMLIINNSMGMSGLANAAPKGTPQKTGISALAFVNQMWFVGWCLAGLSLVFYAFDRRRHGLNVIPKKQDADKPLCGMRYPSVFLFYFIVVFLAVVAIIESITVAVGVDTNAQPGRNAWADNIDTYSTIAYSIALFIVCVFMYNGRHLENEHDITYQIMYVPGLTFSTLVAASAISSALSSIAGANFDLVLPLLFVGYKVIFLFVYFFLNAITWRMGPRNTELRYMFIFQFTEALFLDGISFVSRSLSLTYGLFLLTRVIYGVAMQLGLFRKAADYVGITTSVRVRPLPYTLGAMGSRAGSIGAPVVEDHFTDTHLQDVTAQNPINRVLPRAAPEVYQAQTELSAGGAEGLDGSRSMVEMEAGANKNADGASSLNLSMDGSSTPATPAKLLLSFPSERKDARDGRAGGLHGASMRLTDAEWKRAQVQRETKLKSEDEREEENEKRLNHAARLRQPFGDTPTAQVVYAAQGMLASLLSLICVLVVTAVDKAVNPCFLTCGCEISVIHARLGLGLLAYVIVNCFTVYNARRKLRAAGIDWHEALDTIYREFRSGAWVFACSCTYVFVNFVFTLSDLIAQSNLDGRKPDAARLYT